MSDEIDYFREHRNKTRRVLSHVKVGPEPRYSGRPSFTHEVQAIACEYEAEVKIDAEYVTPEEAESFAHAILAAAKTARKTYLKERIARKRL